MKNSKKKILRARYEGKETLAKLLELENKQEESDNNKSDNEGLLEVLCAMDQSLKDLHKKEIPAPIVNVEEKELVFPKKMTIDNLKDIPQPNIKTEKVEFPKEIKEIPGALREFAKYLKQKAKDVLNVKITNDAIGVLLMGRKPNGKLKELDTDKLFNIHLAGPPHVSSFKDAEGKQAFGRINPEGRQQVEIVDAEGDGADVITTNGLKGIVAIAPGHVSTDNSREDQDLLVTDEVFTGEWENIVNFGVIVVSVFADVASATDGLMVQFSTDGTPNGIVADDSYTISAGAKKTFSFQAGAKFFRVLYTNGGSDQGHFHLQVVLKPYYVKPSSHRIQDSIIDDDDAELVKSILSGKSDITGIFENIISYRGALQVDNALVHRFGISEHAKRDTGGSTTFRIPASAGDKAIDVVSASGFSTGDLIRIFDSTSLERSHFHITNIAGTVLTLDRPLDNDFIAGDDVKEIDIAMNKSGSLASPISYKVQPVASERFQLTRILITMLDGTAMDDGKFGGLDLLANGVLIRISENGKMRTLTHWKSNSDLKDDMFDVVYSDKAPAGEFGLSGRWTFTKGQFVVDLNGANGDYLEVLIQDNLTGLLDFEVKAQGRLFGS